MWKGDRKANRAFTLHVAIRKEVAWLEVPVEQGWLDAMAKAHGQAGLRGDVELGLPGEAVCGHHLLQGAAGHELHHHAQGLPAHP